MKTSVDRPTTDISKPSQQETTGAAQGSTPGLSALAARLYWMGLGNVILMGAALLLAQQEGFSAYDAAYVAVALSLVAVRFADVRWLHGLTKDGEPATMKHWRTYALIATVASALLWGIARLASPFIRG